MATPSFQVHVAIGGAVDFWHYDITINGKRLIAGDRATKAGAKRAAKAQLNRLKRDIEKALSTL